MDLGRFEDWDVSGLGRFVFGTFWSWDVWCWAVQSETFFLEMCCRSIAYTFQIKTGNNLLYNFSKNEFKKGEATSVIYCIGTQVLYVTPEGIAKG